MPSSLGSGSRRPPRSSLLGSLLGALLFGLFVVPGCGGSDGSGTSSSGSGGSDGSGGAGSGGSAKPACESPGGPTGPTPLARADTAGALSADGKTFMMFGGDTATVICGETPKREHVGDTWLLDTACGGWTELAPATAPSARARHAVALDAARNRALLFGGRTRPGMSGPYTLFDDVWAFDFATSAWSEIATTGSGPSKRSNAAAAISGDRLIVFGGSTSTDGLSFAPKNDAYSLDLISNVWTKLAPAGPLPDARLFHALAADPSAARVYAYAGGDENAFVGPFFDDLWALDLDANAWTEMLPGGSGTGRIKLGMSATAAPGAKGVVVHAFAGHDDGALGNRNDVIAADLGDAAGGWSEVKPGDQLGSPANGACDFPPDFSIPEDGSPERRSAFAFGALPGGAAFVVVGGDSDCGRLSDAWWFDTATGSWAAIRQTLVGLTCARTGSTTCSSLCG